MKFDVINVQKNPQVSPSGSRKDQVPRDAPMSALEQILLQVFAHSCRQRVQLDGPAKGMGYYADAPTNTERVRWWAAIVASGTSETT